MIMVRELRWTRGITPIGKRRLEDDEAAGGSGGVARGENCCGKIHLAPRSILDRSRMGGYDCEDFWNLRVLIGFLGFLRGF